MADGKPLEPEKPATPAGAILRPGYTFTTLTDKLASIALSRRTPVVWFIGAGVGFLLTMMLLATITAIVFKGVGLFGVNVPVGWGFDILNFVWWIGIGHAGTLISAILLLLRQPWRNSINRFAEAMTIFAVSCAGLYPLLHTGRDACSIWSRRSLADAADCRNDDCRDDDCRDDDVGRAPAHDRRARGHLGHGGHAGDGFRLDGAHR